VNQPVTNGKLLRARLVYPVSSAPIDNGAVLIHEGLIQEVGPYSDLSKQHSVPTEDLGEVTLLPGLVNAHCHLDYTNMAGLISPPAKNAFPDWIKNILALKAHWSYTEFAQSWVNGARQLLDSGVTTVGDIEAVPELLPDAWDATRLHVVTFLEMTGVRSGHQPVQIFTNALAWGARLHSRKKVHYHYSPHALYSTPPALIHHVAKHLQVENFIASIHLAESQPEWDMYQNSAGPLYDWLKGQRPMDDTGGRSPIQQAHRLGALSRNLLAIHCNYLAEGDAELLAANNVTVVHCPRSHQYFQHAPFPYDELARASVKIALGTDSLASALPENGRTPTLNFWKDLQLFARNHPSVSPETILRMATQNGARALWTECGELTPGFQADLIAIPYSGPYAETAGALLETPAVIARYISGQRV
jgi:aminodeoxyfutalosine deaminase